MTTKIQVRKSNVGDASLDSQYFIDRGYTVLGITFIGQRQLFELGEDLADDEKNELMADLMADLSLIDVDVSDGAEVVGTAKQRYKRVIDRCTRARARRGFEFPAASGNFFPLAVDSQAEFHRLWDQRANLTYPYRILQQDNTGGVNLAGQAAMNNFFDAMHGQLTLLEQDAVTVKGDIQTAASKVAARAVAVAWLELPGHCPVLVSALGL